MNGERFDVESCGPAEIAFDSLVVNPEAGVFDLMALLPAGLPRLDGLISLQTFTGFVVAIDLARNRLEVDDALDAERVRGMRTLPIRWSRGFAGAGLDVLVRVRGAHGPLWFELDSGNLDSVLISNRLIDQLDFSPEQIQSLRQGSPMQVPLQIDGLGQVTVAAKGAEIIYDGVLNADFLERVVVVLDLKHGVGWAKLNNKGS